LVKLGLSQHLALVEVELSQTNAWFASKIRALL